VSDRHDPGLYGKAAFVCDHCKELIFWKGPDKALQEMVDDLRESDLMECPNCREMNDITDQAKEMMR
jgi:phage FluMu protein Com